MCLDTRGKMISFDLYENFTINRMLLLTVGLWPYQRSKLVLLQLILFSVLVISLVIFQLTTFLTTECTPEFVMKILSSALFFLTPVIGYSSFWIKGQNIKYVLEQFQRVCNELRDENEIAVIKKYGGNAKFCTTAVTYMTVGVICILICLPIWPCILNIYQPTNESRTQHTIYLTTEYFIDPDRYYYLIMLHMEVSGSIAAITIVGIGMTLTAFLAHACGMFRIASYRIEQALSNDISRKIGRQNEMRIYKEIIYAVDIHRKAIKFSELTISSFKGALMFLISINVISFSLNLLRVYQIMSFGGKKEQLLLHLFYTTANFMYMFVANYAGQEVTDHNNHVFITTYNGQWYATPLHTQRMILFLLQKGTKEFHLNIGGLIIGSLETFASLVNVSLSYFTVMYSTTQQ